MASSSPTSRLFFLRLVVFIHKSLYNNTSGLTKNISLLSVYGKSTGRHEEEGDFQQHLKRNDET